MGFLIAGLSREPQPIVTDERLPDPNSARERRRQVPELRRSDRRRPALLPGLRPALLAGATAVPRRAAGRERAAPPVAYAPPTAGYLPPLPADDGALGWLRRYSGLFGLIAVLLICGLIGLLVGHWLAPSKASGPSIVKIEGTLPAAAATSAPTTTSPTPRQRAKQKRPQQNRAGHRSAGSQGSKRSRNCQGKAEAGEQTKHRHASETEQLQGQRPTSRKSKS